MNPLLLTWLIFRSSLLSTGGLGNVPALHDDLVATKIVDDQTFAESIAVGQLSPGPNGLWVVALGYVMQGPLGALLATIAVALPPFLVIGIDRMYQRVAAHPAVEGFVRGLTIAVVGVFVVTLYRLAAGVGLEVRTVVVIGGALALAITKRVPILIILALGGAIGLIWR